MTFTRAGIAASCPASCTGTFLRASATVSLGLCLLFSLPWNVSADEPESVPTKIERSELMMELVDLILDKHITPITRQEMVRQIISATLTEDPRLVAQENAWARRISQVGDRDSLRQLLAEAVKGQYSLDADDNESLRKVALDMSTAWPELAMMDVQVSAGPDQKVNAQLSANRYVGIGIALTIADGFPVLSEAIENGPAHQAGMRAGDRIVLVENKPMQNLPLTEVIDLLRGPEGSVTQVRWETPRTAEIGEATITRGVVPIASLEKPIFSTSGKTVLIHIKQLSASTVHELRKIEASLSDEVELVVIDFKSMSRTDDLHLGVLLGDALLDQQPLGSVLITGQPPREIQADAGRLFPDRQLALRVLPGTTGVLKWIAYAAKASKSAVVFGQPTAAPALVNDQFEIAEGRLSVRLPIGVLIGVGGKALNPTGIEWLNRAPPYSEGVDVPPGLIDKRGPLPGELVPDVYLQQPQVDTIEEKLLGEESQRRQE